MSRRDRKHPASVPPRSAFLESIRDWHLLILGAVLVCVFFHEIVLRTSFFWEDFLYQFYPFRTFATVALAHGQIPLWNPYTFCGMPFAADITGTVFYLPHLLLVPAVSGDRLSLWFFEMFIVAHFLLAAVSMFFCGKSFGLSRIPAAFAALVYTFSGFMITHTIHTVVVAQVAWFPLALLLFKKTLDEESPTAMILSGFVLSMIVCGGHIQITLYFFVFLFAFFILELVHGILHRRSTGIPVAWIVRISALAAGVVIIAVGLSAIQILPTMELSTQSVREDFTFARTTEGELTWPQLVTLLVPKFFGVSNALGRANPTPFWGPEAAWDFWETCVYVGVAAFALSLFAALRYRSNRHVVFVAGFALFSLLFALGDNFVIHPFFYQYVPGFNRFRVMGRWGFFISLAGALLSGFGLQALLSDESRHRMFPRILAGVAAVPVAALLALKARLLDPFLLNQIRDGALRYDRPDQVLPLISDMVSGALWTSTGIALVACLFLFLIWKKSIPAALGVLLLFATQFLDLYMFGFSQNNGKVNPDDYFNERRQVINRLVEEGKHEYFRVNIRSSGGIFIDRNQGMMDRIFLTDGYTQLALLRRFPPARSTEASYRLMNTRYRTFIDTVQVQRQRRLQFRFDADSAYLPRAFIVHTARTFRTPDEESAFMSSAAFDPRTTATFEEDPGFTPSDSLASPPGSARIDAYDINEIDLTVSTQTRGILVLSEIYFPGWNATVDGSPVRVLQADWCLRALVVEPGEHRVRLRYEPAPFRTGATISATIAALSIAGYLYALRRRRRRSSQPPTPEESR